MLENFEVDLPQFEISELPAAMVLPRKAFLHCTMNFKLRKVKTPVKLLGCGYRDEQRMMCPIGERVPSPNSSKEGTIKRFALGNQNSTA